MKIYIASDHAGFKLKEKLKKYVQNKGLEIVDLGTEDEIESVSYVKYGDMLANELINNDKAIGIGICGSGIGISIALNRHKGIRAARVSEVNDGILSKKHNNANAIVFGGRQISEDKAEKILEAFMKTEFEGDRHIQRIKDLDK